MALQYPSQEFLRDRYEYRNGCLLLYGKRIGGSAGHGYWRIIIGKKSYYAHRLIWIYFNGTIPDGKQIDHISGDTSDNRVENLRLATRSQQNYNKPAHRNSRSGLKGAHYCGDRRKASGRAPWHSQIRVDGKLIFLGYFWTPEEAHAAYCTAAKEHCGGFSRVAA